MFNYVMRNNTSNLVLIFKIRLDFVNLQDFLEHKIK